MPMFVFYVHVVLATRERVHVSLNCCAVGLPFVFPRGRITQSAVTSGSPSDRIDVENVVRDVILSVFVVFVVEKK